VNEKPFKQQLKELGQKVLLAILAGAGILAFGLFMAKYGPR
jgi:hypothetical protein